MPNSGEHTPTEKMRITSGGNVGIGESNPITKLFVGGGTSGNEISVSGGYGSLNFWEGANISGNSDTLRMGVGKNGTALIYTNNAGLNVRQAFAIGTSALEPLVLSTNNTERMRIAANGSVAIHGSLSKGSGSFKIDHPLEEKKDTHDLVHSFVESPQANNIYRGKVQLVNGTATVNLDEVSTMTEGTFTALNRDIHTYTSNESDWDAVRGKVEGNILTIECQNTESTATVSWLVIGERQDKHMYDTDWTDENGKVIVEPEKTNTDINGTN